MSALPVLFGFLIFNLLLGFFFHKFTLQMHSFATWINEKQLELLNVEGTEQFHDTIENNYLQQLGLWMLQTNTIIRPTVLIVSLATMWVVTGLFNSNMPGQGMLTFLALAQSGLIVATIMTVQRTLKAVTFTKDVNEQYIKLKVLKEADKIEAETEGGDNNGGK